MEDIILHSGDESLELNSFVTEVDRIDYIEFRFYPGKYIKVAVPALISILQAHVDQLERDGRAYPDF